MNRDQSPDPSWPSWATEAVRLVPADPAWPERGRAEAAALDALLAGQLAGGRLVAPIEHFGSTAVPGLAAKPILDLLAAVTDLDVGPEVALILAPHGWHFVPPELDGRAYERFFVKVVDGHRAAHLHLVLAGSSHWSDRLRFRDRLRGDPQSAADYAALKTRLAAAHAEDRERYSAAKHDFVQNVLRQPPGAAH
jgi:GrpB-like predicted nucleotidyltransferase (UPF0157 family)